LGSLKQTPTEGPEALTAIPQALQKLKTVKEDLNKIQTDVKQTRQNLNSEMKAFKSQLQNLKNVKDKDLDNLLSRLNLDFASPDRIVQGLLGGAILNQIHTGMHYIELARRYMPSKKETEKVPVPVRSKGVDVIFPKPASPPRFWLKHASLSGIWGDVGLSGSLSSLSSEPSRLGKPTVVTLEGIKEKQRYKAQAIFDHATDIAKDSLDLEAKNLRANKLISGGILGEALKEGWGDAEFVLSVIGEDKIGGRIALSLSGLKLDRAILLDKAGVQSGPTISVQETIKARFLENVAFGLEQMSKVNIEAQIFGSWRDPDLKLTSNLGPTLAKVIKDSVGNVAKEQREKLELEINKILQEKTKDLQGETDKLNSQLESQLGGFESKIQTKIQEATGLNFSPLKGSSDQKIKIPSLDKLFKK